MPKKYATSFDFNSEIVWIKDAESYTSSTAALNAKVPPEGVPAAKGDGTVDDTSAIQGLINYAKTASIKTIFLPPGSYSVRSLTLASGVSIVGIDPYNTKLVLRGGATNPLLSGNVQNILISGLTLDANSGSQTGNISTVVITSGTDVTIRNAIIDGGYVNLSYIGAGGSLIIDDVIFKEAVYKHLLISGNTYVQADSLVFETLSQLSANCCMDISTDYGVYRFNSNATTPACIRCAGIGNLFEGFIHNAVDNVVDTGTGNDYIIYGQSQTETLSGDRKITAANLMETVAGDKTVNANDVTVSAEENLTENASSIELHADTIYMNTDNPLKYGLPTNGKLPMRDKNGTPYNLLVDITGKRVKYASELGIVNDGVTDCTDAFNAAVTNPDIDVLILDGGTYLISNRIGIFDRSNFEIIGNRSVIKAASSFTASQPMMRVYSQNTDVSNVYIRDIDFEGDPSMTAAAILIGSSETNNCHNIGVYNCNMTDCTRGIQLAGYGSDGNNTHYSDNIVIAYNTIKNCTGFGIVQSMVRDTKIVGNTVENCQLECLTLDGITKNCVAANNHLIGSVNGSGIIGTDGCENCRIIGNLISNNGYDAASNANYGVSLNGHQGVCKNLIIDGNNIDNVTDAVFIRQNEFLGGEGVTITGNIFENISGNDVEVTNYGTAANLVIMGNVRNKELLLNNVGSYIGMVKSDYVVELDTGFTIQDGWTEQEGQYYNRGYLHNGVLTFPLYVAKSTALAADDQPVKFNNNVFNKLRYSFASVQLLNGMVSSMFISNDGMVHIPAISGVYPPAGDDKRVRIMIVMDTAY